MTNHKTKTITPHFEVSIGPTQQHIDWHAYLLSVFNVFCSLNAPIPPIISHFFYLLPHMTQHPKEVGYKWIEGTNEEKALVHQRVRDRAGIKRNSISR